MKIGRGGLAEKAARIRAPEARGFGHLVIVTGWTNLLLAALGVMTGVLAARLLGAEGRGELAAIQLWPSAIGTIAMIGLPEALVYFSAREPAHTGRWVGSAVSLALVSSVLFAAVGYLVMPVVLNAQPPEVVEAARWYLVLVPLYALVGMPYHALRGRQEFAAWNALRLLPGLGWLVVLVLAWVIGKAEPRWLAGAYLAMLAALFLPVTMVLRQRVGGPYRPKIRDWRPLMRFGLPSAGSGLPQVIYSRLDQLALAALLPTSSLGLYAVAVTWGSAVVPLLNAIGSATFPRIAADGESDRQWETLAKAVRMAVLVALALGMLMLAATPWAIPLVFGPEFGKAVPAAAVFVVGGMVCGITQVMEEGLRGLGRPRAVLRAELTGAVVMALVLWLLLPAGGLTGAALASLAGYAAAALVCTGAVIGSRQGQVWSLFVPTRAEFVAVGVRLRRLSPFGR